ncbi:hypothetical protein AnigIFM56816_003292 [Aspergillus niger]|nr:hypothetical protein AnigIFM56816_003292 [Aspergillus niger]
MDHQFSYEPSSDTYDDRGLAHGIPLRVHLEGHREVKGSLRAQADWNHLVSPIKSYNGGLGPKYSFMQVTVPGCLPERLEIISYANEFAFLYDGGYLSYSLSLLLLFITREIRIRRPYSRIGRAAIIINIFLYNFITCESATGTSLSGNGRNRQAEGYHLDESLVNLPAVGLSQSRVSGADAQIWFGTLTFGMALTIPEEELNICMELARPGYAAISLTNDLFSWPKERRDAVQARVEYVFNAVWIIMEEEGLPETAAMQVCEAEIRRYIAEYEGIVRKAHRQKQLSQDTLAYLDAVRYSHVGNLVWSIYCPRYRM